MKQRSYLIKSALSYSLILLILTTILLAWSPWVNEKFVESRIYSVSRVKHEVYSFEKVPFGAISLLFYLRNGGVEGITQKVFSLEYTSFTGQRKYVYGKDLDKIHPPIDLIIEQPIIERIKEKFPEVKDIEKSEQKPQYIGEPPYAIYGELRDSAYIIAFSRGWGDCPSGCIQRHWWYFEVKTNGDINKIGEKHFP